MKSLLIILLLSATSFAADTGVYNVLDYGAVGDGKTLDTLAIQKAIDTCASAGGGQVLLPPGKTYLTGTITIRTNVDFHLASGAILKGSANYRDYLPTGAFLFAKGATNITLSGEGAVDGNDTALWQKLADEDAGGDINKPGWWPESFIGDYWPFGKIPGTPDHRGGRPMMVIFIGCTDVHMHDVTLRSAPSWTVHLVGCRNVAITQMTIHNSWEVANNDGIDIDHCRDVRIANCGIDSADDCIVVKNTPNFVDYGDCEHITVSNCTVKSRSAALKVDEVYVGTARDIIFDGCTVSDSNRGLAIQSRDVGNIENVIFSNIVVETKFQPHKWWGAAEVIHVTHYPRTAQTTLGHVRNIRFSNLICRGENGMLFQGYPANPLEDITLENIKLDLTKPAPGTGGFYDLRPGGVTNKGVFQTKLPALYVHDVRHFAVRNARLLWSAADDPEYGPPVDQGNAEDLQLENVVFGTATAGR